MRPAAALLSLVGAAVAAAPAAANPSRLVTPDYWGRVLEIDPALQTRACRDALFRANRETRPACFIPFGFFVTEERVAAYCAGYEPTCSVEINHHVRNLKTVCAFGALPYGAEHRYNRHYVHLEYLIGTFENACQKYEISPGVEGYCSVFKKNYLSEHGLSFTQQDRRGLDDFKNVACHHGCSDLLLTEAARAISRLASQDSPIITDETELLCDPEGIWTVTELGISTYSDENYQETVERLKTAAAATDAFAKEAESVFTDDMIFSFPGSRESYAELLALGEAFHLDYSEEMKDGVLPGFDDASECHDHEDDYFGDGMDSESFWTAADDDVISLIEESAEMNPGVAVGDPCEFIGEEAEAACGQQNAYLERDRSFAPCTAVAADGGRDEMLQAEREPAIPKPPHISPKWKNAALASKLLRKLGYSKRRVSRYLRTLSARVSSGRFSSGRSSGGRISSERFSSERFSSERFSSGRFTESVSGSPGRGRRLDSFGRIFAECFVPEQRKGLDPVRERFEKTPIL